MWASQLHSFNPSTVKVIILIFLDAPVIYIGAFPILTAQLGCKSIYNNRKCRYEYQPTVPKITELIKKIQPRMMVAIFNCYPSTTIIYCYSPTYASDETDLDTFYNKLSSLVCSILKHNVLTIGGDINAQIGKNINSKFSLYDLTNRNGEHLTDFTLENGLMCLNTKFQKRKGKLGTFTYPNCAKALIDYIFVNKKWIKSALNCEAYSFFEGVSSDHWIVMAKIHLSLQKNAVLTTTTAHYDWSLLNNKDISD